MKKTHPIIRSLFPNIPVITFAYELKKILNGCETMLDIGCGEYSPLRFVPSTYSFGVDAHKQSLTKSKKNEVHDKYLLKDVRKIHTEFEPHSFDACVAIDLIEHLTKKEGLKLIDDMLKIARKCIVIFTPNGFLPQHDANKLQEHQSGWTTKEMKNRGFEVIGIFGDKRLRGDHHHLKLKPKVLGGVVSEFTQYLYARNNPRSAAALLCYKDV